jgi:hypothetical protein
MELQQYIDKRFTLWLMDENDDSVLFGDWVASQDGETLLLQRGDGRLKLDPDWLSRIRPVKAEVRGQLLNADFFVVLTVGMLPESFEGAIPTGMRWPE